MRGWFQLQNLNTRSQKGKKNNNTKIKIFTDDPKYITLSIYLFPT